MYHSYEQAIRFIQTDQDCIKSISFVGSVFLTHQDKGLDEKKALLLCHKVAVKLARLYNKKITKLSHYTQVFTPSVIDRIKYFVYDISLATVKESQIISNDKK